MRAEKNGRRRKQLEGLIVAVVRVTFPNRLIGSLASKECS